MTNKEKLERLERIKKSTSFKGDWTDITASNGEWLISELEQAWALLDEIDEDISRQIKQTEKAKKKARELRESLELYKKAEMDRLREQIDD